ncbi:helix-turn-helix domain-containing protein [Streptomyces sp. CC208A]|uniref:helix-turn-helix domain-containing protein n=1 Tax=Streptomyces sp. CC208A TaxID=3044573 RepID=UPI0024A94A6A|nr:helix-turn-helix domain-containing protein [Streptomyces sp. CC208A]
METLALRLSGLDPYVDGAIRIVTFYDTLMRRRVDLPALVRASAGLAECVTGLRLHGTGRAVRVSPLGTEATGPEHPASSALPVTLDEEEIGEVWLERRTPAHQLDEVLLERLAIAVAAAVERYGPARTTMADPALVELAVGAATDDVARARALRLLGFAAGPPVHVVAVRTGLPLDRIGARVCPGGLVKAATLGADGLGALLATAVDPTAFPEDVRAGLTTTADTPSAAWHRARTALRFTTSRAPVLTYDSLGALALLADIPERTARANPDVAAIARLAASAADGEPSETLETLDAYCATASVRRAADRLHLHHSTVSRRLDHLGRALSLDLTTPDGLTRARLALTLWRLLAPPGSP